MATLKVLGRAVAVECGAAQARRLADLAVDLENRLDQLVCSTPDEAARLILTALTLLDEAQVSGAALTRALIEIDRLHDLLAEAHAALEGESA